MGFGWGGRGPGRATDEGGGCRKEGSGGVELSVYRRTVCRDGRRAKLHHVTHGTGREDDTKDVPETGVDYTMRNDKRQPEEGISVRRLDPAAERTL